MLGFDTRAARYVWTAALVLLLLAIVYRIRETLFVFILAILFAYMLWPMVRFLDRRLPGRSRVPALAIVYMLLIGVLILIGFEIGTRIASEANALAAQIPELISKFEAQTGNVGANSTLWQKALLFLRQQMTEHSQSLVSLLSKGAVTVLSHAEVILFIVLVPVLSFFFLKDGPAILREIVENVTDESRREKVREIAADIHLLLAQYIRALVLLSIAAFGAYGTFLAIIRAPYPVLLAAIAAPLEFIPMIGPLAGAAIIVLVAGLSGFHHVIFILVFLAVYRVFQDYVLSPYLLSAGMELHPLLVIFGVMAGGEVAGVAGAFLAVLVLAIIRIVYRQLQTRIHSPEPRVTAT